MQCIIHHFHILRLYYNLDFKTSISIIKAIAKLYNLESDNKCFIQKKKLKIINWKSTNGNYKGKR